MSSWVYSQDSTGGIKGVTEFVIRQDTLLRYDFTSDIVSGPCKSYPDIKSDKYSKLYGEAIHLYNTYLSLYGKPVEYHTAADLVNDTGRNPENVFYAKWKKEENELSISISLPDKNKRYLPNGPPPTVEEAKPGCMYTLEVMSIGTGNAFQKVCGNGIRGEQFKLLHPKLASQAENHPDSWTVTDTLTAKSGNWKFTFENGNLASYSLWINDGEEYDHITDTAYSRIRKRILALKTEAEKKFGKPTKTIDKMLDKFPGRGSRQFQKNTYFAEEWLAGNKKTYLLFEESSNFKEPYPLFTLELYYGKL